MIDSINLSESFFLRILTKSEPSMTSGSLCYPLTVIHNTPSMYTTYARNVEVSLYKMKLYWALLNHLSSSFIFQPNNFSYIFALNFFIYILLFPTLSTSFSLSLYLNSVLKNLSDVHN